MSANYLTPENIIAFRAKNGPGKMIRRSVGKNSVRKNTNAQFPTWYLSLQFQTPEGSWVQSQLKFIKQVLGGNAKTPPVTGTDGPKFVNYTVREINEEMIKESDYKTSDYPDLLQRNKMFINALNILNEEFAIFIKNDIIAYEGAEFEVLSEETSSFIQDSRKASKEEKADDKKLPEDQRKVIKNKIKLDVQLIRFRIPIDVKTPDKRIGINTREGVHIDMVFDARKQSRTPAIIKQKVGNETKDMYLTMDNAANFITYMSLTGGLVDFELSVGEKGIGIQPKLRELHVAPHRKLKKSAFADNEFDEMRSMATNESDAVMDEPVPGLDKPKSYATKEIKTRPEVKGDVDGDNDESEQEEDSEPRDQPIPSRPEIREVFEEKKVVRTEESHESSKIDEPVVEPVAEKKVTKKKGKKTDN